MSELNPGWNKIPFAIKSRQDLIQKCEEDIHTIDLINLGINMFRIKGLEEWVNPLYFERSLFFMGANVLFKDRKGRGYFVLPFAYSNRLNAYGVATKVTPIGYGQDSSFGDYTIDEDCVIIRDNPLETPPAIYALYYGKKIGTLYATREKNNKWLMLPSIFKSTGDQKKDDKNALEIKNVLNNITDIAQISGAFNELVILPIKAQYAGAELELQIKAIQNDFLDFLGVGYETEKKERELTNEVALKSEKRTIQLMKRALPRIEAVEKANKMFPDLNLSLDINGNSFTTETQMIQFITSKVNFGLENAGEKH